MRVDRRTELDSLRNFKVGKNLDDQARSCRSKIVGFKAMLQAIETNTMSCTQSSASHNPEWFITFTSLAKASRNVNLLPKY